MMELNSPNVGYNHNEIQLLGNQLLQITQHKE